MGLKLASIRKRVARALDPDLRTGDGLSLVNRIIVALILASVILAVLQTEPTLDTFFRSDLRYVEWVIFGVFGVEYAMRIWCAPENPTVRGRFAFAFRPTSIIDLLGLIFFATSLLGFESILFRLARLGRLVMLAKLGRFSVALNTIWGVLKDRRFELAVSAAIAFILLLATSAALYIVEGGIQPVSFGSIPRAMWWSIATLTTVGYGDAVPITIAGRLFAGISAIAGIGLVALPAGILAAAFSDALQRLRKD